MFSCVAAPEMIQYYLDLGISSEYLIEKHIGVCFHRSTVPVGAGAVFIYFIVEGYILHMAHDFL